MSGSATNQEFPALTFAASVASSVNSAFGMVNCDQPQSTQTRTSANLYSPPVFWLGRGCHTID
jgi:hypothetical protein